MPCHNICHFRAIIKAAMGDDALTPLFLDQMGKQLREKAVQAGMVSAAAVGMGGCV